MQFMVKLFRIIMNSTRIQFYPNLFSEDTNPSDMPENYVPVFMRVDDC